VEWAFYEESICLSLPKEYGAHDLKEMAPSNEIIARGQDETC
jgi:hypothetical protein